VTLAENGPPPPDAVLASLKSQSIHEIDRRIARWARVVAPPSTGGGAEFVTHYHRERNHQGLDNELIDGEPAKGRVGRVRRHHPLGGLLNYYARAG